MDRRWCPLFMTNVPRPSPFPLGGFHVTPKLRTLWLQATTTSTTRATRLGENTTAGSSREPNRINKLKRPQGLLAPTSAVGVRAAIAVTARGHARHVSLNFKISD